MRDPLPQPPGLRARQLGLQPYPDVWRRMREFTDLRPAGALSEIWFLEHPPVFTLGQAGKAEHLLAPGDIPVVKTDRGGQVTYHGPGQLVVYLLLDLRELGIGVRSLVGHIEGAVIDLLATYGIDGAARREAPGVYVGARKIAALGLRVRRGCTYHGLSLNVDMDVEPFSRINPCGFPGLEPAQLRDLGVRTTPAAVAPRLLRHLCRRLGYTRPDIQ